MSDPDRRSTYAAEDMLLAWLDATSPETGEVRVTVQDGQVATFVPETEPRFSHPSEVAPFVDRVLDRLRAQAREFGSGYRGRERREVTVLEFAGWTKATYRDDTIVLPQRERGGAWALRALVVLHELAHHRARGSRAGGERRALDVCDEWRRGWRAAERRRLRACARRTGPCRRITRSPAGVLGSMRECERRRMRAAQRRHPLHPCCRGLG